MSYLQDIHGCYTARMGTKFRGIKTAAEYERGEFAKDVLRLIGAGVVAGASVVAPNTIQLVEYFQPRSRAERNKIWNTITYLERKGYVTLHEHNGQQYLHLTKTGRIKFDEERIWELTLANPARWDHKWRIVMFDFPSSCKVRHVFRAKLEDFGFQMYQRSVFIYPHECQEEVIAVAKWYGVEDHIRYLVATEIHDMRRFVEVFKLL